MTASFSRTFAVERKCVVCTKAWYNQKRVIIFHVIHTSYICMSHTTYCPQATQLQNHNFIGSILFMQLSSFRVCSLATPPNGNTVQELGRHQEHHHEFELTLMMQYGDSCRGDLQGNGIWIPRRVSTANLIARYEWALGDKDWPRPKGGRNNLSTQIHWFIRARAEIPITTYILPCNVQHVNLAVWPGKMREAP